MAHGCLMGMVSHQIILQTLFKRHIQGWRDNENYNGYSEIHNAVKMIGYLHNI